MTDRLCKQVAHGLPADVLHAYLLGLPVTVERMGVTGFMTGGALLLLVRAPLQLLYLALPACFHLPIVCYRKPKAVRAGWRSATR